MHLHREREIFTKNIVIFHTVASSLDLEFLNYYAIKCTLMILNMIISLSYPLNFGIYCGMSQQFRETFMKLFGARIPNMPKWCCRCKRENDSHTSVDAVSIYFIAKEIFDNLTLYPVFLDAAASLGMTFCLFVFCPLRHVSDLFTYI